MALPKLASAKFELTLPSTGEKVEYRPFLVKEEKALMIAQQAGKSEDIMRAVKDVITSCTFEKVDAEKLPIFDLEYIFINLRAKSVGEIVKLMVTCPDDNTTKVQVDVDLTKIECHKEVGHDTNIRLTDEIGLVMDYPRVSSVTELDLDNEMESTFEVIKSCVRQVYDSNNVYEKVDMDKNDLDEFIESMTHDQFERVQEFFNTMPKVRHMIKVKNPKTGVDGEVVLEGMQSFF
tara:strand:+ start:1091 stop:1792 length:702 start_codon:yes stop_codon:yes gene_type:complete